MAAPQIQGAKGTEILRKALQLWVDVSGTTGTSNWDKADWEVQGYRITDSVIDADFDETDETDILGNAYHTVNSMNLTQTLDPNYLRAGDKLNARMVDEFRYKKVEQMSQYRNLIVYGFLGEDGAYPADAHCASTNRIGSLGGESRVGAPFDAAYGGEIIHGTVDSLIPSEATFTPDPAIP